MNDFLTASKDFGGGDGFVRLLNEGLDILGDTVHEEIAKELEVIPSSILRWSAGIGLPLPGMQVLCIRALRQRVEQLTLQVTREET